MPSGALDAGEDCACVWVDGTASPVDADGSFERPYITISSGLVAVAAGGVVYVLPAAYPELVNVADGKRLQAVQKTSTGTQPVAAEGNSWGGVVRGTITAKTNNVTIDGFAVAVPEPQPGVNWNAILIEGGAADPDVPGGSGCTDADELTDPKVVVSDNLLTGPQNGAIGTRGIQTNQQNADGVMSACIENNTIVGVHFGIYVDRGAAAAVLDNDISATTGVAIGLDSDDPVVVEENFIHDNVKHEDVSSGMGIGVHRFASGSRIKGNRFERNGGLSIWTELAHLAAYQNWWGDAAGPKRSGDDPYEPDPQVSTSPSPSADQVQDEATDESEATQRSTRQQTVGLNIQSDPWCRDDQCTSAPVTLEGAVTRGGSLVVGALVKATWTGGGEVIAESGPDGRFRLEFQVPWSVATVSLSAAKDTFSSIAQSVDVSDAKAETDDDPYRDDLIVELSGEDESETSTAASTVEVDTAQVVADGESFATVTLTARNAEGERRAVGGEDFEAFASHGAISDFVDHNNGLYTWRLRSAQVGASTVRVTHTTIDSEGNGHTQLLPDTAEVTFVVGPASAAATTISASPAQMPADGKSTSTVTVRLNGAGGQPITTNGDEKVGLSLAAGSKGTLTPAVENSNGTWTATLASTATPGDSTITGTLDNGDGIVRPLASTVIVKHVALDADAGTSSLAAAPTPVAADGRTTSTVTVQAKDSFGNPRNVGGDTVVLISTRGTFKNGAASVTGTTDGTGKFVDELKSATDGAADVTAKINGKDIQARTATTPTKVTVTFTPGLSPSQSTITISPTPPNVPANGTATATVTVQAMRSNGTTHPVAGIPVTLGIEIPGVDDGNPFFVDAAGNRTTTWSGSTNSSGQLAEVVRVASEVAGVATVRGTIGGGAMPTATVTFRPVSDPARTTITASAAHANTGTTVTITLTPRDSQGSASTWAGESVSLTVSGDAGATFAGGATTVTGVTGSSGYTATISASGAGSATVTGTIGGQSISGSAAVTFHAPLNGPASSMDSNEDFVVFGGTRKAIVTVQLKGADGLPRRHPSDALTIETESPDVVAGNPTRDLADFSIFRFEVSSQTPRPTGTKIRAKIGSTYLNGATGSDGISVVFEPGSDPQKSILTSSEHNTQLAAHDNVAERGIATVRVTTKNALDQARRGGGDIVVPTVTPDLAGISLSSVEDKHDGTYVFTVTSTVSGDFSVGAKIDGVDITTDKPMFKFRTAASGADSIIAGTSPVDAGGSTTLTVTVKDDGGRDRTLGGDKVKLTWLDDGITVETDEKVTAANSNTATFTFTAPQKAGIVAVQGAVNGGAIPPFAITVRGGVAVPAESTMSADSTMIATGGGESTITLSLRDQFRNPSKTNCTSGNVTFFASGSATLGVRTSSANECTVKLRSPSQAGSSVVRATLDGALVGQTASVDFRDVPAQVTLGTATAGNEKVNLTWTRPAEAAGSSPVTGYTVKTYLDAAKETPVPAATVSVSVPGTTAASVPGLTNGTQYWFTVAATSEVGDGAESEPLGPVTPEPQAPQTPAAPTGTPGNERVALAWTAPVTEGSPITGYTVRTFKDSDGSLLSSVSASGLSAKVSGLVNGTAYRFTVIARSMAGDSPESATSAAITPAPQAPGQPAAPTATAGDGQAHVTWVAPVTNGSPVSGYSVRAYRVSDGALVSTVGPVAALAADVTGLVNGTAYGFTVVAHSAAGDGTESPMSAAVTPVAPTTRRTSGGGGGGGGGGVPGPAPVTSPSPSPSPSETTAPDPAPAPLPAPGPSRVSGGDRTGTAASLSRSTFADGADVVYIVASGGFADALAGGPAAAREGSPILLVNTDSLPESTRAEIERLRASRVVVLGGDGAVSPAVAAQLASLGVEVERVSGGDRFSTAAAVSQRTFTRIGGVVYIATGDGFADALSGGAAAARNRGPVLLVNGAGVPAPTEAELRRLAPSRIVLLGGSSAVPAEVAAQLDEFTDGAVKRLSGSDRYATSAAIAAHGFPGTVETVYIATGENFPDALAGVPAAARERAPLLLVQRDVVPEVIGAQLGRLRPRRIVVLGGEGAVSAETARTLDGYVTQ